MPKHNCPDTIRLIKSLCKQGCTTKGNAGDKILVYSPNGKDKWLVHIGGHGRSYHPLRRWAKKQGFSV